MNSWRLPLDDSIAEGSILFSLHLWFYFGFFGYLLYITVFMFEFAGGWGVCVMILGLTMVPFGEMGGCINFIHPSINGIEP